MPGSLDWEHIILGLKRTTRDFLDTVVDNLSESIIVTDLEGKIVYFNKGSEMIFGYRPEEILGRHIILLGVKHPNVLKEIRQGKTFRGELIHTRKGGETCPTFVICIPLKDEHGQPIAMVGSARDLTKEKEINRLKEELFQSEKMTLLGKLAGEIAHEINNPLSGLILATQMLHQDSRTGSLDPQQLQRELRGIEEDARRCKRFIEKLLGFSRRIPEEKKLIQVNDLIEDALLLVERQAALDNVSLVKDFSATELQVWGNANNLQQVLINLVNNAREAIHPSPGRVEIRTRALTRNRRKEAVIEVLDSGRGIPPGVVPRLFDSFFTTKEKGTGLGLAVSKRIVEEHEGTITASNRREGGAAFRLTLPRS